MNIRRAIPIVESDDLDDSRRFYGDFLGFEVAMEMQGLAMFRSPSNPTAQVIAASPTAAAIGAPGPRAVMSVEVGDVDAAYAEAQRRGLRIVYPITDEPWGIRRFFVEDPDGNVVNVAMHIGRDEA
jgi:catechol 2,3-dioxygenase-like lactoylglutathione lyase family enzyme